MTESNKMHEQSSALFTSTNSSSPWSPHRPFASLYLTRKLITALIQTPGKGRKGQNYDGSYIKYFADKYIDIISPFLFRIEQKFSDNSGSSSDDSSSFSSSNNGMNRVDLLLPYLPQPLRVLATLSLSLCREHSPSIHWPICVLQYIGRPDIVPTRSSHRHLHPTTLRKHAYSTSTSMVSGASVGVGGGESVGVGAMDGLREVEAASIEWFPEDERVHEVSVV